MTQGGLDHQIRIKQFDFQPTLAYAPTDKISVGVGAILSIGTMKTDSLDNGFGAPNPGPRQSTSRKYGGGVRVGAVWDIHEMFAAAAMFKSPTWYEGYDPYKNTFSGPINSPMQYGGGIRVSPATWVDLVADARKILWSDVDAIGSNPQALGGFGWDNQTVVSVGLRFMPTENLKLRMGYTHGNSPIDDEHVFANFLLPAVTEHHFNIGASYDFSGFEIGFSGYFSPENQVKDTGAGDSFSVLGKGTVLSMGQYGAQVSMKVKF